VQLFFKILNLKKLLILLMAILSFNLLKADFLLRESFTTTTLPTGWTNTAIQGTDTWLFRSAPTFNSLSGGGYAVFDDQLLGAAVAPNESALITKSVNCTGLTTVKLRMRHYWYGVEFTHGYVEVSNDAGATWNLIKDFHKITKGSLATPHDTIMDISAFASNQANVQVRFRYTDGNQAGKFWYIDDIWIFTDPDAGVKEVISPTGEFSCGK